MMLVQVFTAGGEIVEPILEPIQCVGASQRVGTETKAVIHEPL